MLRWFYCLPLRSVIIFLTALIWLCGLITYYVQRKFARIIYKSLYIFLLLISVTFICYMTIYNRPESIRYLNLIPFDSFSEAKNQPEMYRTMLMNVALFTPFGISCALLLNTRISTKNAIFITVTVAFLISVFVESTQYIFYMGLTQTDDVICNTLGAGIGATVILVQKTVKYYVLKKHNYK